MQKPYKIIVTPQAENQLFSIRNYIKNYLKSPTAALKTINILETAIMSLSEFPNRIPIADENFLAEYKLHKMVVKNYLIYFTVEDSENEVNIIAVIYSHRNQENVIL